MPKIDISRISVEKVERVAGYQVGSLHIDKIERLSGYSINEIQVQSITRISDINISQLNVQSCDKSMLPNMRSACNFYSPERNNLRELIKASGVSGNSLRDVINSE